MDERNQKPLVDEVIQKEWKMFDKVNAFGGRASCQDNFPVFYVMRYSQFSVWDKDVLESYYADLLKAESQGMNIIEQKYAYMMRETSPDYYEKYLREFLPGITEEKKCLAEQIMEIVMGFYSEAEKMYPGIAARGRGGSRRESISGETSVDVYQRGELLTYSSATLKLYYAMVKRKKDTGQNMVLDIYARTAECCGYDGLEAAEEAARKRKDFYQ